MTPTQTPDIQARKPKTAKTMGRAERRAAVRDEQRVLRILRELGADGATIGKLSRRTKTAVSYWTSGAAVVPRDVYARLIAVALWYCGTSLAMIEKHYGRFMPGSEDAQLMLLLSEPAGAERSGISVKPRPRRGAVAVSAQNFSEEEWSQRESNPCYRRERPVS